MVFARGRARAVLAARQRRRGGVQGEIRQPASWAVSIGRRAIEIAPQVRIYDAVRSRALPCRRAPSPPSTCDDGRRMLLTRSHAAHCACSRCAMAARPRAARAARTRLRRAAGRARSSVAPQPDGRSAPARRSTSTTRSRGLADGRRSRPMHGSSCTWSTRAGRCSGPTITSRCRSPSTWGDDTGRLSAHDVRAAHHAAGRVRIEAGLFSRADGVRIPTAPAANAADRRLRGGGPTPKRSVRRVRRRLARRRACGTAAGQRMAVVEGRCAAVVPPPAAGRRAGDRAGSAGERGRACRRLNSVLARICSRRSSVAPGRAAHPHGRAAGELGWAAAAMVELEPPRAADVRPRQRLPSLGEQRTRASWACACSTCTSAQRFERRERCPSSSCSTTSAASTTPAPSFAPRTAAPWRSWCCAASRRGPIRGPPAARHRQDRARVPKPRCRGTTCRTRPRRWSAAAAAGYQVAAVENFSAGHRSLRVDALVAGVPGLRPRDGGVARMSRAASKRTSASQCSARSAR